jgi:hypothetical protein
MAAATGAMVGLEVPKASGVQPTVRILEVAMAFYGFYTSLGGRPLFGGAVLEE